jgi:hypothetical protein
MTAIIKKIAVIAGILIFAVLILSICTIAARGALAGLWGIPSKLRWKEKTTPLEPAVVKDLCQSFALPSDDPKCDPEKKVYAPDFFGVVMEAFAPEKGDWATYD